jgi:hypothetical protein
MPRIKEQALKAELAKRSFESVSIKRELPGGRIEVEANKLYPVHVEAGEAIYAPVPVSLSVELDARGRVKSIAGDTPNPAAVTDAARYIKTLRDSGQLTSTGEQHSDLVFKSDTYGAGGSSPMGSALMGGSQCWATHPVARCLPRSAAIPGPARRQMAAPRRCGGPHRPEPAIGRCAL